MSVTNCDAPFYACNLYVVCTTKGSPGFWIFLIILYDLMGFF